MSSVAQHQDSFWPPKSDVPGRSPIWPVWALLLRQGWQWQMWRWVELAPGANKLEEEFQKSTSISVSIIEQDHKNHGHKHLSPYGESQLPPVFPQDSPRSASRSNPGSFPATASALRCRPGEILHTPFKSEVSVFDGPLLNIGPTGFQNMIFWELIFAMRDPLVEEPHVGIGHLTPWEEPLQLWCSFYV